MSHTFLVELGTEELPPTSLLTLSTAFLEHVQSSLKTADIQFESIKPFATPRRLALIVQGLPDKTPIKSETVWGPPKKVAFDDQGQPSKAALAFAKKNNIAEAELQCESDGKQEKLVFHKSVGGNPLIELLPEIVSDALANLPISKRMRWGSSRTEFVRPTQWLVMLFDEQIVNANILGQTAGNTSYGHRIHGEKTIAIPHPNEYETLLEQKGFVLADFSKRRELIRSQTQDIGKSLDGQAVISDDLLDEVTALVEWPNALSGKFEEAFLEVPAEALISSMKEHQKYFHVVDNNDALLPYFITVSNIQSSNPQSVVEGNEKVIRPRLADAAFFFETDKKTRLEEQRERLKSIVFQAKLGTVFQKTERIESLATYIGEQLNADNDKLVRAAQLCKSDLVTNMVYEFTDLQGIAGYYYAKNDGEDNEVALAMNEQYLPRFAGDSLATTLTGNIIGLADRLDTIAGIFGLGQVPTGSKDPFGLRRASLAALRILVENNYDLDLRDLLEKATQQFDQLPKGESSAETALQYMLDRFAAWYEEDNITPEVFQSVKAKALTCPLDINDRIHAVASFCSLPEASALAEANKRVANILAKQQFEGGSEINTALFEKPQEKALLTSLENVSKNFLPLIQEKNYTQALAELAALRDPVDAFFTDVMVMADDEAVRLNRLALLSQLRLLFLEVADISCLVVKK